MTGLSCGLGGYTAMTGLQEVNHTAFLFAQLYMADVTMVMVMYYFIQCIHVGIEAEEK